MDTQEMMKQLRQSDEDLERDFIDFCRRHLVGLPESLGVPLAQQLLHDYNAFLVERAMKARKFFNVH